MYTHGWGVPKDTVEGAKWYRRAAEQGYADGQDSLGFAYYRGDGVPQDYQEAAKWLRLAAEQGLANSQNKLGWMYATGEFIPSCSRSMRRAKSRPSTALSPACR